MRSTYPNAEFDLIDVTAAGDSIYTSETTKGFSDMSLLKEGGRMRDYGTLERNQFLLDGSREIFTGNPEDVPYWSRDMSDSEGFFADRQILRAVFSEPHSSIGLTLYFSGSVPAEVSITWYSADGAEKLIDETFFPDRPAYFCRKPVENYGRIDFAFLRTELPGRYVKMEYVEYGMTWRLDKDVIKSASVYEEMDPMSATLSINTADIQIVDKEDAFDPSGRDGMWRFLQKSQKMELVEYVDGVPVDFGSFYLDTWNTQKNLVALSFVDLIGVMDKTDFYDGEVYQDVEAGEIIGRIMSSCGVESYSVAEEVAGTRLTGWLGIQRHRAALQQVVFACGAVADCSRSNGLRIYKQDRYVSHTVGMNRRFMGTKITLDEYISDVSVAYEKYIPDQEAGTAYKGILSAGMNRIGFSKPYQPDTLRASRGEIVMAATNYVLLRIATEGECEVSGCGYKVAKNVCTASVPVVAAGKSRKEKKYSGCTVIGEAAARNAAERILDYFKMRQLVEMRYVNDGEAVGNWCNIAMRRSGYAVTGIISQDIDLTGGFVSSARCRGYSEFVTELPYMSEIWADERGMV